MRLAFVDVEPVGFGLGLQELLDLMNELLYPWFLVHWARTDLLARYMMVEVYVVVHTPSECGRGRRFCWAPSFLTCLVLVRGSRPDV